MADSWIREATFVAEAFNVTVIFGVRPKGTWFVHADSIEYDCAGPEDGTKAIANALIDRTRKQHYRAKRELEETERVLRAAGVTH